MTLICPPVAIYSEKMLWNPSVTGSPAVAKAIGPLLGR